MATIILAGALSACNATTMATPGALPDGRVVGRASHQRASWISAELRHTSKPLLYVADTYAYEVAIYMEQGRNQQPVGELTNGITFPYDVWVDTHRNVYVSNGYSELQSNILRFRQGATKPDLTLPDPGWNVGAIWVGRDGSVYAVNGGYSGNFEIVKYPPHEKTSQAIGDPNLTSDITSIVGDERGDLFASGFGPSGTGEIDELISGSTHWQNTGISLAEPGGLAFDAKGNLVASDIGRDVIERFPLGSSTPTKTIACSAQCWAIAFDHRGDRLWVDEVNDLNGTIDEFRYPRGKFLQTLNQPQNSYPLGVATTPDLYP